MSPLVNIWSHLRWCCN